MFFKNLSLLKQAALGSCLLFSSTTFAQGWSQKCSTFHSALAQVKYCIAKGPSSAPDKLLYFFHGAAGSEHDWLAGSKAEYRAQLNRLWEKNSEETPTVISFSVDSLWLFGDEMAQDKPLSKTDDFIEHVLLKFEAHRKMPVPRSRVLMGTSMGGYNALRIGLELPHFFDAMVLIAPLSVQCDPHASSFKIFKCLVRDRNKENKLYAAGAHALVKAYFESHEEWIEESPSVLARKHEGELPPIYVSTGKKDDFGFYKGSKDLAEALDEEGFDVTWKPTNLKHSDFDEEHLAEFLKGVLD